MVYLDPRTDVTFKRVFGEHKHLCISLLNSLLPLGGREIVSIEYLSPEVLPDSPEMKNSIVDVKCRDNEGRIFIVEMQMYWTEGFFIRTLLNACKSYSRQAKRGADYVRLKPVYTLCLLNQNIPNLPKELTEEYRHVYYIQHERCSEVKIDGLTFVYVELPKYNPKSGGLKKMADLWLSYLNCMRGKEFGDIPEDLKENAFTNEAIKLLEETSYSEEEMERYDAIIDSILHQRDLISTAKNQGREEGREEGRVEEKREIALKLLSMGLTPEQVSQGTGLALAEIGTLRVRVKE